MNSELLGNKKLYKLFISLIKFLPITLSVIHIIALIINYIGFKTTLLACLGGSSILFIGLLFIISFVFKFCYLYRIPLWYITIMNIMNIIRFFIGIPIDLELLYRIYLIMTGFFTTLFIGYMYKNRNNPKVDPIKHLCENYCGC